VTGRFARTRDLLVSARWPLLVVVGILLVNLPALVHIVDVDPLGPIGVTARHVTKGFLPGTTSVDSNIGYTAQALGHRAALDWLHLHVPWWNPYEGVGSPLAAEMQSAAFFPPVLLMALTDGSLYFHVLMELIAGLATWFLVRELELPAPVATVGGLLFGLCGTFDWLWHAPMNPVPFLPLALLGVERAFRRPDGNAGWMVLALALALSVYAGFPETAYLDLLLVVVWAVLRLAQTAKGRRRALAVRLALGAGVGALLSFPLAIPFATYLPGQYTGTHALGIGNYHLSSVHMAIAGLPYLYGPQVAFDSANGAIGTYWGSVGGFVAAGTLVMALAGLLGARRHLCLRLVLGATSLVVVLWSFGVEPFSLLTRVLPYMSHVDIERYTPPIWEMGAVLLACFGLDALGRDRRAVAGVAGGGAFALVGWAVLLVGPPGSIAAAAARHARGVSPYTTAMVAWAGGVAVVLIALGVGAGAAEVRAALRRRARSGPLAGPAASPARAGRGARACKALAGVVLCIDAGAMAFVPQLSAPRSVTLDLAPAQFLADHLGLGRYYSFWVYHGNYGAYFGLASINTTDNPVPAAWANEISTVLAPNFLPARFDGRVPINPSGPSAVTDALQDIAAYEALDVRYFVVQDLPTPVFGSGPVYPYGMQRVFDDGFISIFALPDPAPYFRTVAGGTCSLQPAGRGSVTVDCRAPATLVRAELDMQGWTAAVSGRLVPIAAYQGLLDSVRVPAGRSVVTFSYSPPHIEIALAGFLLGLVLLAGVPAVCAVRRRRAAVS
jgi:hypothetical protein